MLCDGAETKKSPWKTFLKSFCPCPPLWCHYEAILSPNNDLLSYDNQNQNDWLSHNNDTFSHNGEIIPLMTNFPIAFSNCIALHVCMCIKATEVSGWSKADQNYFKDGFTNQWFRNYLQPPVADKQQLQTSGKLHGYGWMHQKCWMAEIITNREMMHR